MLTKKMLRQLRTTNFCIMALQERIESLRAQMENTVIDMRATPVQTSRTDVMPERIAKLVDWERELEVNKLALIVQQRFAERAFDALDEPLRSILSARYIQGLSWSRVADALNYSEQHCKNLHSAFLKTIESDT